MKRITEVDRKVDNLFAALALEVKLARRHGWGPRANALPYTVKRDWVEFVNAVRASSKRGRGICGS